MKRLILAATFAFSATASAQSDLTFSERLHKVLSAEQADRIVVHIEAARLRQLPAKALEQQALMLTAKGAQATQIEKAIDARADGMERAKAALAAGGRAKASDSEIEAGGELVRRGVDGARVSELAKSVPSGRSLALPLYVIGSLMDRGLPSDSALARVRARLMARATDSVLARESRAFGDSVSVAYRSSRSAGHSPAAMTGRDLAATKRPATAAGGRPATVPANAGRGKPEIPGSHGKGRGQKG